ncbi:hypothetical protein [Rubinisphaera sp. JC750]|uniref:hypothetical protein n=1 Tax=Rubinisphaera sp. JC750 TaxID=2898658 RepID=UPI001F2C0EA7|nr:hypothetical protein [Rubinisphaera sp. JC750]
MTRKINCVFVAHGYDRDKFNGEVDQFLQDEFPDLIGLSFRDQQLRMGIETSDLKAVVERASLNMPILFHEVEVETQDGDHRIPLHALKDYLEAMSIPGFSAVTREISDTAVT